MTSDSAPPPAASAPPAPAPAPAARSSFSVAVQPLVVHSEDPEFLIDPLTTSLTEGLERGEIHRVPPERVISTVGPSCADQGCYLRLRDATGASHILRTTIVANDNDYQIKLVLYSLETGEIAADAEETCDTCGLPEVGDLLATSAALLITSLETRPGTLVLTTTPPGARVYIDGELVGASPLELDLKQGTHALRVSMDNYRDDEREVSISPGVKDTLKIKLARPPEFRRQRGLAWASLVAGALAVGGGVGLLYLDGRYQGGSCDGTSGMDVFDCGKVYNTDIGGAVLLASGAALMTLGVAALVWTRDRKPSASVRAGLGPSGLVLRGRF